MPLLFLPFLPSPFHWCSLLLLGKGNRIGVIIWDRREAISLGGWHVPPWRGRLQLHRWMLCTAEEQSATLWVRERKLGRTGRLSGRGQEIPAAVCYLSYVMRVCRCVCMYACSYSLTMFFLLKYYFAVFLQHKNHLESQLALGSCSGLCTVEAPRSFVAPWSP